MGNSSVGKNFVNPAQAKAAAKRCVEIGKLEWEYADTMAAEKVIFQGTLQDMIDHPDHYNNSPDLKEFASSPPEVLRSMKAEHARVMDEMIEKVREPYSPEFKTPTAAGPINKLFISTLMPTFAEARIHSLANRVYNRQLTLEFALRAYKLEHKAYPDKLQQLVPDYLPNLPADPFARQGTFQYYPQRDMYLLYSLGPDGQDDHGTAYTPPNEFSKWVKQDTKGDIVAGRNDL